VTLLYIVFGWVLGLFSPIIVEHFRSRQQKKEFETSVRIELKELQFRLAFNSLLLEMNYGRLTVEIIQWVTPILDDYEGDESYDVVNRLLAIMRDGTQDVIDHILSQMRAAEGVGVSLKIYQPSYLVSNLAAIAKMSPDMQQRFHEFFNHLSVLNQEIQKVEERQNMTFDAAMTEENHERLVDDIKSKYVFIAGESRRVATKIEAIISR